MVVHVEVRVEDPKFYPVWINTWQFDLIDSPSQAVIDILKSIIQQITSYAADGNSNKYKTKLWSFLLFLYKFRYILIPLLYCALWFFGISYDTMPILKKGEEIIKKVQKIFDKNNNSKINNNADIVKKLKSDINNQVKEIIGRSNKKGFIFFIDDLDRIDPKLAINLLEVFKNLFDIEGCVFILAMDYNVLLRGLQSKLGPLTTDNKHEFLRYFDKFVQLPITLPVCDYDIKNLLKKDLHNIGFLKVKEEDTSRNHNKQIKKPRKFDKNYDAIEMTPKDFDFLCNKIIKDTIGSNPRSLKRMTNILALIDSLRRNYLAYNKGIIDSRPGNIPPLNKIVILIFVCLQITFPEVYHFVINHPQFTSWDNNLADSLDLPEAGSSILNKIKETSLNTTSKNNSDKPENWELFLLRFCKQDQNLQRNFIQILFLVNEIIDKYKDRYDIIEEEFDFMKKWLSITDININSTVYQNIV